MLFENLKLDIELKRGLKEINYTNLTKIQEISIEHILNKKDLIGIAKTGSGKTGAFSIPILQSLLNNKKQLITNSPRVLILAPTRELVIQIDENIKKFSKYLKIKSVPMHGGIPKEEQIENLEEEFDIAVSTPQRIYDLTNEKITRLKEVEYFIIDEVDKMFDINSSEYVKKVIKLIPKIKQSIFLSATISKEVEDIISEIAKEPIKVDATIEEIDLNSIEQSVLYTKKEHKYKLLLELLNKKEVKSSIIFVNSRKEADNLVRFLSNNKINSFALHSKKSNVHREKVIEYIKSKTVKHLVATDLASRGLDLQDLTHIFNFELPTTEETYIHRIGRTGRLNSKGCAYSFCSSEEKSFLDKIEKLTQKSLKVVHHEYHSEFAKNAKGKDAKPQFKKLKNNFKKKKKK